MVNRMGQQFLTGAGFAQQQNRRFTGGAASRPALDLHAGRAAADKMRKAVFGLARLQQGAGRGELFLDLHKTSDQRRKILQLVEEGKTDRANHRAGIVVNRQAHHH